MSDDHDDLTAAIDTLSRYNRGIDLEVRAVNVTTAVAATTTAAVSAATIPEGLYVSNRHIRICRIDQGREIAPNMRLLATTPAGEPRDGYFYLLRGGLIGISMGDVMHGVVKRVNGQWKNIFVPQNPQSLFEGAVMLEFPHFKVTSQTSIPANISELINWYPADSSSAIASLLIQEGFPEPPEKFKTTEGWWQWIQAQELSLAPNAVRFFRSFRNGLIDYLDAHPPHSPQGRVPSVPIPVRDNATARWSVRLEADASGVCTWNDRHEGEYEFDIPVVVIREGVDAVRDWITERVLDGVVCPDDLPHARDTEYFDHNTDNSEVRVQSFNNIEELVTNYNANDEEEENDDDN